MRRLHNLNDKQRIQLLKLTLGISVGYHVLTAFVVMSAYKSYEKGRAHSLESTINRIFEVLEPTEEQLQEISTVLDFDRGIDQMEIFLKKQK